MANYDSRAHNSGITSMVIPGISDDLPVSKIRYSTNSLRAKPLDGGDELVNSIKLRGLLHPILVRSNNDSQFEVVAGNRRLYACRALKWKKIACHIMEMDDKEAFEVSLIENIQRKSLDPQEEARAFKSYVVDYGWGGVSELSQKLGKSVSYIAKRIKLLELPKDILSSLSDLSLSTSVAEELLSIDNKDQQSELAQMVKQRRLTSKSVREIVKEIQNGDKAQFDINGISNDKGYFDKVERSRKSIDKSIAILRIAMNRISALIESNENNWIVYEILMQHKNMLHTQIGILLKEKTKMSRRICG